MNTRETRVRLFAAIEGGSLFWSNEIATFGSDLVLEKIISNGYRTDKNSIDFISREIKNSNSQQLLAEITAAGASFITPESAEWPTSLNDLIAPPLWNVAPLQIRRQLQLREYIQRSYVREFDRSTSLPDKN